jgi:hypothetical protein
MVTPVHKSSFDVDIDQVRALTAKQIDEISARSDSPALTREILKALKSVTEKEGKASKIRHAFWSWSGEQQM